MDYAITSMSVRDTLGVNPALQPIVNREVSFYVGKRGPFYLTYAVANYNPETVIADVQKEVANLKVLDAGVGLL